MLVLRADMRSKHDSHDIPVEHYAILDDADSILPEHRANFFQTTWETGLTEDIALAVEKHLNEETINNFADQSSAL